jgi:hypothetical protein
LSSILASDLPSFASDIPKLAFSNYRLLSKPIDVPARVPFRIYWYLSLATLFSSCDVRYLLRTIAQDATDPVMSAVPETSLHATLRVPVPRASTPPRPSS